MADDAGAAVEKRASFAFIRYASVWEDAEVLCDALAPVAKGGRLLSIASAGDNVLALLTLDPAEVVAVDLSGAQLACRELRPDLSTAAQQFWDGRAEDLATGIVHAGRFEHYFRLFRRWVLPWIHGR